MACGGLPSPKNVSKILYKHFNDHQFTTLRATIKGIVTSVKILMCFYVKRRVIKTLGIFFSEKDSVPRGQMIFFRDPQPPVKAIERKGKSLFNQSIKYQAKMPKMKEGIVIL